MKFAQEFLRWYKERILLKNAANDDQRMRPHDVNYRVSSKLRKIVRADDRVIVVSPYVIDTRFELNEIFDVRCTFCCPVHMADNAAQRKSPRSVAAGELFEDLKHPILIETAVPEVGLGVGAKLELSALLRGCRIDPSFGQALQMVGVLIRIHDMDGFVATLEPVLYERKQYSVLFLVAIEKRADMTRFAELRTGKGNGYRDPFHGAFSHDEHSAMRVSGQPCYFERLILPPRPG
jgi:hypothetical protein